MSNRKARTPASFWPVSAAVHAGAAAILALGIRTPEPPPVEIPPAPIELRLSRLSAASDAPAFEPPAALPDPVEEAPEAESAAAFPREAPPSDEGALPPPAPRRSAPPAPVLDRPLATTARRPVAAPAAPALDESSVAPPSPASNPPPEYPRAARRQGLEGVVLVSVRVSPEGRVLEACIACTSGHRMLDEAALSAIRRWAFTPGLRDGRAVEWTVEIPVRFRLQSGTARS